jgi:hypothetical protein
MNDDLKKSMEHFERLMANERDKCFWRIDDKSVNFILECWLMKDKSVRIYQIFRTGAGFMQYIQNDEI